MKEQREEKLFVCPRATKCEHTFCFHKKPHKKADGLSKECLWAKIKPVCIPVNQEEKVRCPKADICKDDADCKHRKRHKKNNFCNQLSSGCPACIPVEPEPKPEREQLCKFENDCCKYPGCIENDCTGFEPKPEMKTCGKQTTHEMCGNCPDWSVCKLISRGKKPEGEQGKCEKCGYDGTIGKDIAVCPECSDKIMGRVKPSEKVEGVEEILKGFTDCCNIFVCCEDKKTNKNACLKCDSYIRTKQQLRQSIARDVVGKVDGICNELLNQDEKAKIVVEQGNIYIYTYNRAISDVKQKLKEITGK